ncbi:hypothetical protein [Caldinitratiruptor microaerophilus]|uniref:Uncharacterized protein n=1 Tax=Caldinitratiruptor microaerophilus TaxID=671077 RepID=A0AA35CIQ7_9FIRM|nr:hypothetical protein [Caldinitratiruptor microaerophilus]BDG59940.1 hypothetical protein caldi_10300 [Caldinitratiruptor microaerophilus]
MPLRLLLDSRGSGEAIALVGGLLVAGTALVGGVEVARTGALQNHLKRLAEVVVENVSENGCYDARTDAQVREYLSRARLDPGRLALSATTVRQPYGEGVQARVEYVRPVALLGLGTPLGVRVAATATGVSNHVAPVRNAACTRPSFGAATGNAGVEPATVGAGAQAGSPSPSPASPEAAGTDFDSPAFRPWQDTAQGEGHEAPACGPVTRTRTATRYRDEEYPVQVDTREETRYREETYEVPVQRTRTVTRYRTETYQVQVGTRAETRYREVTRRKKVCTGTLFKRCTYRTYRDLEPYTEVVPVYETRTRQVPYETTETYTAYETRTRQVPYTVSVPVYETRVRSVPYTVTETYVENTCETRSAQGTSSRPGGGSGLTDPSVPGKEGVGRDLPSVGRAG